MEPFQRLLYSRLFITFVLLHYLHDVVPECPVFHISKGLALNMCRKQGGTSRRNESTDTIGRPQYVWVCCVLFYWLLSYLVVSIVSTGPELKHNFKTTISKPLETMYTFDLHSTNNNRTRSHNESFSLDMPPLSNCLCIFNVILPPTGITYNQPPIITCPSLDRSTEQTFITLNLNSTLYV